MNETEAIGESRSPVTHVLKTWPGPFYGVRVGAKPYEIRRDDRNFRVGDTLHLCEWCPEDEAFSGAEIEAWVTYKTEGGEWGLPEGLCVLGIDVRMIWIHSGPEFQKHSTPPRETTEER